MTVESDAFSDSNGRRVALHNHQSNPDHEYVVNLFLLRLNLAIWHGSVFVLFANENGACRNVFAVEYCALEWLELTIRSISRF